MIVNCTTFKFMSAYCWKLLLKPYKISNWRVTLSYIKKLGILHKTIVTAKMSFFQILNYYRYLKLHFGISSSFEHPDRTPNIPFPPIIFSAMNRVGNLPKLLHTSTEPLWCSLKQLNLFSNFTGPVWREESVSFKSHINLNETYIVL